MARSHSHLPTTTSRYPHRLYLLLPTSLLHRSRLTFVSRPLPHPLPCRFSELMISELAKEKEFIESVITFFKAIQAHYPIDEKDEPIDEDLVHFANAVS